MEKRLPKLLLWMVIPLADQFTKMDLTSKIILTSKSGKYCGYFLLRWDGKNTFESVTFF